MAVFTLRRSAGGSALRGAAGDTVRRGSGSSNAVYAAADLTLTLTTSATAGLRLGAAADLTLTLTTSATGLIRPSASADLTLTLTTSATAGNWANAATETADVPEAMTLRLSLYATATVITAVVPPPTGSTVAPIKRVSITMPAPTLDANGRPT